MVCVEAWRGSGIGKAQERELLPFCTFSGLGAVHLASPPASLVRSKALSNSDVLTNDLSTKLEK